MLRLPSGRVIDLSTDRARYHALRKPGPHPNSPHAQLYALVDILYRHHDEEGDVRRGWTEFDYHYSPYTLADIRFAQDWSDEDKQALQHWIREPQQYQRIETTRRRLEPDQARYRVKSNSAPQHLYSLLQQRLQTSRLHAATREQWHGTLNNMLGNGLRQEELQWSGLTTFLKRHGMDEIISKAQMVDAIAYENIAIELTTEREQSQQGDLNFVELAHKMSHQAVYRAALKLDNSCHCILRYRDTETNYRVGVVKTLQAEHPMKLNRCWFALDPYGRAIQANQHNRFFSSSDEAMQAANTHAYEQLGLRGGMSFRSKYAHLSLYGGKNYREWLVTLSQFQRSFFGAHHYDHNVLAHIRTTSRLDQNGKRILFIEEVQSDWHQQGSMHGYDNNPWGKVAHGPFKKEWALLALKLMLIRASQNGYHAIAWPNGEIQEQRYQRELTSIKRYYNQDLPKALNRLCKPFNIQVECTNIATCEPWLNLVKAQGRWRVEDAQGKFKTRNRYQNRDEAMRVLYRHSRQIDLQVQALFISDELRWQIAEKGLPLFGTTLR